MVERKDRFESKQTFTTRAFAEWNSSSDAEREQFLNALATAAYKMSQKHFLFKQNTEIVSWHCATIYRHRLYKLWSASSNWFMWKRAQCLSRQKTVFAIKRAFFVKKVLCDIKYSRRDIFQDSVLNDKYFMSMVTKLSFEIGRFSAAFFESLILKTFFSENQRSMKNLT